VSSSKDLCTVTVNYLPCSAAFLACLASYVLTYFWVQDFLVDIGIAQSLFRYMYSVLWSLFLTCLFFLGSVYMLCEQHDFFRQPAVFQTFLIDNANWIKHLVINTWSYSDYITVRALIVGPITEEIVYRSCMVSCLLASGWDAWNSVVISSVLFGVSHTHHLFEHLYHGNHPIFKALVTILFQLCYTTVFAAYCGYIFVKTGNLLSCVLIHSWCNHFSIPDFAAIKVHPNRVLIIGIYVSGILLFSYFVQ
jgi:membrane protease YdiL (CAAX protease family)